MGWTFTRRSRCPRHDESRHHLRLPIGYYSSECVIRNDIVHPLSILHTRRRGPSDAVDPQNVEEHGDPFQDGWMAETMARARSEQGRSQRTIMIRRFCGILPACLIYNWSSAGALRPVRRQQNASLLYSRIPPTVRGVRYSYCARFTGTLNNTISNPGKRSESNQTILSQYNHPEADLGRASIRNVSRPVATPPHLRPSVTTLLPIVMKIVLHLGTMEGRMISCPKRWAGLRVGARLREGRSSLGSAGDRALDQIVP